MQADSDRGKAEEFKDAANALEHGLLETPNPSAEKEEIGGDADAEHDGLASMHVDGIDSAVPL